MKYTTLLFLSLLCAAQESAPAPPASSYQPVTTYDFRRDAEKDLREAVTEATRTHKRILVEVGGQWCVWCGIMDKFFDHHPELAYLRDVNFVVLKVYVGPGNPNTDFRKQFPRIDTFPYIFVLDENGVLLKGEMTRGLEDGGSYDLKDFTKFLNKWATIKKCPDLKHCKPD